MYVVVFFYDTSIGGGQWKIFPPHHVMALNPVTGEVENYKAITPSTLGINQRLDVPILAETLSPKPSLDGEKIFQKEDRLKKISPLVWEAYGLGQTQLEPKTKSLLREYSTLFFQLESSPPFIPYYKALSPNFFKWLEDASH